VNSDCDSKICGVNRYGWYFMICDAMTMPVPAPTEVPTPEPTNAPTVPPTASPTSPYDYDGLVVVSSSFNDEAYAAIQANIDAANIDDGTDLAVSSQHALTDPDSASVDASDAEVFAAVGGYGINSCGDIVTNNLCTSEDARISAAANRYCAVSCATTTDDEASSSIGVIVSAVVGVIVVVAAVAFVVTKRTAKESDGATVSTEVATNVENPMRKESDQIL
jgi:hypothetical protein